MSITYQIRKWAVENKLAAQGLIALSTVALFYLGHVLGVLAEMLDWDPYAMFLLGAGTGILAWTLAPRKGEDFPIRYTYARQKVAMAIMLTSMTVGIGGWAICLERMDSELIIRMQSRQSEATMSPKFSTHASENRTDHILADWFHGGISKRVLKQTRRWFKRNILKHSLKRIEGVGGILVVLITLILASLIAFLSYSLSCNGQAALSALVGIGGLLIVLAFLNTILKKLKNNPPKKTRRKKKEVVPDSSLRHASTSPVST